MKIAALLTRISMRPNAFTASAAMRLVSSSLRHIDLERQCFAAFGANLLGYRFAVENIGDHHRRAFFSQAPAVCRANVARAAGDDGDLACQSHIKSLQMLAEVHRIPPGL